jgi:hypothetical protein
LVFRFEARTRLAEAFFFAVFLLALLLADLTACLRVAIFRAGLRLRMAVVKALACAAIAPSVAPIDSATLVRSGSSLLWLRVLAEVKVLLLCKVSAQAGCGIRSRPDFGGDTRAQAAPFPRVRLQPKKLLDRPSTLDDADQDNDDRENQENVDEPAECERGHHAQQPENYQNDGNGPK